MNQEISSESVVESQADWESPRPSSSNQIQRNISSKNLEDKKNISNFKSDVTPLSQEQAESSKSDIHIRAEVIPVSDRDSILNLRREEVRDNGPHLANRGQATGLPAQHEPREDKGPYSSKILKVGPNGEERLIFEYIKFPIQLTMSDFFKPLPKTTNGEEKKDSKKGPYHFLNFSSPKETKSLKKERGSAKKLEVTPGLHLSGDKSEKKKPVKKITPLRNDTIFFSQPLQSPRPDQLSHQNMNEMINIQPLSPISDPIYFENLPTVKAEPMISDFIDQKVIPEFVDHLTRPYPVDRPTRPDPVDPLGHQPVYPKAAEKIPEIKGRKKRLTDEDYIHDDSSPNCKCVRCERSKKSKKDFPSKSSKFDFPKSKKPQRESLLDKRETPEIESDNTKHQPQEKMSKIVKTSTTSAVNVNTTGRHNVSLSEEKKKKVEDFIRKKEEIKLRSFSPAAEHPKIRELKRIQERRYGSFGRETPNSFNGSEIDISGITDDLEHPQIDEQTFDNLMMLFRNDSELCREIMRLMPIRILESIERRLRISLLNSINFEQSSQNSEQSLSSQRISESGNSLNRNDRPSESLRLKPMEVERLPDEATIEREDNDFYEEVRRIYSLNRMIGTIPNLVKSRWFVTASSHDIYHQLKPIYGSDQALILLSESSRARYEIENGVRELPPEDPIYSPLPEEIKYYPDVSQKLIERIYLIKRRRQLKRKRIEDSIIRSFQNRGTRETQTRYNEHIGNSHEKRAKDDRVDGGR